MFAAVLAVGACSSGDAASDADTVPAASSSPVADADPTVAATTTTVPATTTPAPTTPPAAVAHVRGTAYTFNTPDPIAGATIRVEELPDVSAVTAADGSYELELPVGAEVTAYIEAAGHHSIHVQTFVLDDAHDGTELDGVNFQTPSDDIYEGLRALVGGFIGRDPFEDGCVIVTTVGDSRMVGMSFAEFIDFHPHGVAGATVAIEPATATPIYFNDDVLPDAAQASSSGDGGVLWPNVPAGEYVLSATHPTETFVTADVRCETGWVVNANPIWGLHAIP